MGRREVEKKRTLRIFWLAFVTLSITAVSWGCREYTKLLVGTIMPMKLLKTMVGYHWLKAFLWTR